MPISGANHKVERFGEAGCILQLALFAVLCGARPGYAQFSCTPSSTTAVWGLGAAGDWNVAGNWSSNSVPNSTSVGACILDGKSTVSLTNLSPTVNSLTLNTGDGLNIGSGTSLTLNSGNHTSAALIQNAGTITLNSGGSLLSQQSLTSLSGGGTITMTGGTLGAPGLSTLATWDNNGNTIQGYGNIGGAAGDTGGLTFVNNATMLANASGQTLSFSGGTGIVTLNNNGTAEATGGGTLMFSNLNNEGSGLVLASSGGIVSTTANAAINGTAGSQMIEAASGGTVDLGSTTGELNATGLINLSANGGTITVGNVAGSGATVNFATANGGTIAANGAAIWNGLNVSSGSTLNVVGGGIQQIGTLGINNAGTIALSQGELVNNSSAANQWTGGGSINMISGAIVVDPGPGLTNANNTIQGTGTITVGSGAAFTNNGTISANVSGGALTLNGSGVVINQHSIEATSGGIVQIQNAISNSGGTITAGSGSTVQFLTGSTVTGGTLTNNGGTLATVAGNTTTLDGSTGAGAVTINGTYTASAGSTTNILGTINNKGTISVGSNAYLQAGAPAVVTVLSGAGTVTMTAGVLTGQASGAELENVDNTIQGSGTIGTNSFTLINESGGTINANISGATLGFGLGSSADNLGLMEATGGGTLALKILTNEFGSVVDATADGTVTAIGATITGNPGSLLEATTGGQLTIGGPGTTEVNNAYITANGGSVLLTGQINGNLSSGANATLTTENAGTIVSNGSAVWSALTITTGSTLSVNGGFDTVNTLLNNQGTIALNSADLAFYNSQTLSGGGTIAMNSGTFLVEPGATLTNGGNTIQGTGTLDIVDGSSFTNNGTIDANVSSGTFSILASGAFSNYGTLEASNGATLAVSGGLTNGGTVSVSSGSTLTTTGTYTQSAGTTNIGGTLIAPVVSISVGTLEGSGTIGSTANNAAVTVAGGATIQAGDPPATLSIIGTLDLTNSTDNELIGGSVAESGYGVLDVSGDLSIAASLLTLEDLNGFNPSNMETFIIANSNGLMGEFTDNTNLAFDGGTFDVSYLTSGCAAGYSNCIELTFHGSTTAAEPGTLLLLAIMLAGFVLAGPAARVMKSRA